MHFLKVHLLPENSIELIANSIELHPSSQHKGLCSNTLGSSTTTGLRRRSVAELDHAGSSQFLVKLSLTLCSVLTQTSPLSYPFVSVRIVFWVFRRRTGALWFAKESFTDPTLRYLVSFLLRNLVEYNIECLLRPFKVLWSPLRSSVSLSLAQHLEDRSLLPSPRALSTFCLVC